MSPATTPGKASKSGFSPPDRRQSQGWFCTWPQCPLAKERALEILRARPDLVLVEHVVAAELHADGSRHLHAFLKLDRRRLFGKALFDLDDGAKVYHGNYQPARSWLAVSRYCAKGGDYISSFDIDAVRAHRKKLGLELLTMDPKVVMERELIGPMALPTLLRAQAAWAGLKARSARSALLEVMPELPKRHHFYTHGASNTYKTSSVENVIRAFPDDSYPIPTNDDWVGYEGQRLLYLEDFKGEIPVNRLIKIADGGTFVNVKGEPSRLLPRPVMLMITSNFNLEEAYERTRRDPLSNDELESLLNRFNVFVSGPAVLKILRFMRYHVMLAMAHVIVSLKRSIKRLEERTSRLEAVARDHEARLEAGDTVRARARRLLAVYFDRMSRIGQVSRTTIRNWRLNVQADRKFLRLLDAQAAASSARA